MIPVYFIVLENFWHKNYHFYRLAVYVWMWHDIKYPFIYNWEYISEHKQELIEKNYQDKNKTTNPIVIKYVRKYWCEIRKWTNIPICTRLPNPLPMILINRTVNMSWGDIKESIYVRWIKLYHKIKINS